MHLLFWKKRQPDENTVDELLHQSVLWCLVVILVAASSAALGLSFNGSTTEIIENTSRVDQGFYTLLCQILLQLLSSYCTLVPVLRDINTNGRKYGKIKVNQKVFFVNIAVSIVLAIAAPFAYLFIMQRGTALDISSAINFVSAIATTVTASQLAGGIYEGSQKRHGAV